MRMTPEEHTTHTARILPHEAGVAWDGELRERLGTAEEPAGEETEASEGGEAIEVLARGRLPSFARVARLAVLLTASILALIVLWRLALTLAPGSDPKSHGRPVPAARPAPRVRPRSRAREKPSRRARAATPGDAGRRAPHRLARGASPAPRAPVPIRPAPAPTPSEAPAPVAPPKSALQAGEPAPPDPAEAGDAGHLRDGARSSPEFGM